MADTKAVTTQQPGALAGYEQAPDDFMKGDHRGAETIGRDDILLPRLALAQTQSPEVQEGTPTYVEGLKAGDLFNSITKRSYGREIYVQILKKERLRAMEFRPVEDGGGVLDPNVPLDDPRCQWGPDGEKPRATVFRDFMARIIIPQQAPDEQLIALSFKSTGIKVAKTLAGLIAMRNHPMFVGLYRITTDVELKPQPHKIYKVANAGKVSVADAKIGEDLFEALKNIDVSERIDRGGGPDDFDPEDLERAGKQSDM
jgi:hypothetical protein